MMYIKNNTQSLDEMAEDGLMDVLLPSVEQDNTGLDVEEFLHRLTYREHVVFLLRYWGVSSAEIGEVLGIHPSGVYPILDSVRKKALKRL